MSILINYATSGLRSEELSMDDTSINYVNTLVELYGLLSTGRCGDIILIDLETLISNHTDVFSIIDSFYTIIACSCIAKCTKLAIAVDLKSDPSTIKKLLGTKISALYPRGEEFLNIEKIKCINNTLNGTFYIHPDVKELINPKKQLAKTGICLTPRQEQIVSLVKCRGASNKLIAKILNISESTVKLHMSHIFRKFGVKNRTQLAIFLKS